MPERRKYAYTPTPISIKVDTSELDEALAKAERLVELLEKVNDLSNGAAPTVEVTSLWSATRLQAQKQ